jgi:hypothetical protein
VLQAPRGVLGLAAVAALCAAPVALTSAAALAAGNLLTNGTFEGTGSGSLTGWGGSGGTLTLVRATTAATPPG